MANAILEDIALRIMPSISDHDKDVLGEQFARMIEMETGSSENLAARASKVRFAKK